MKKNTKSALLLSVVSIIVCCTMLLGTTMAWFTDSVTSAKNVIVAGNLDVELYHDSIDDANKINDETNLFNDVALWEPGAVVYENIIVANAGNLALKYQLTLSGLEATEITLADGTIATLMDVIKVGIVEDGFTATDANVDDRTEAINAVGTGNWIDFDSFALKGELVSKTEADKSAEDDNVSEETFGIVLYWAPSDVDNNYNMNNGEKTVLDITFGLNLFATQLTYEEDSFDDQYDAGAYLPVVYTEAELKSALENNESVQLGGNIELTGTWTPIGDKDAGIYYTGTLDGNGYTISGLSVTEGDYVSLISAAKDATIKNLTVEGTVVGDNAAGIVARVEGNTVIENCVSNVTVKGATKAGGIACNVTNSEKTVFINCRNTGDVSGGDNGIGGIVGYVNNNAYVEIIDCVNEGDVTSNNNKYAGAAVGYAAGTSKGLVVNMTNTGTINGTVLNDGRYLKSGDTVLCGYVGTVGNWIYSDLAIASAEQLFAFAADVNGGNSYSGKTVVLTADIDLNNAEWTPIGNGNNVFAGTFDGNGYTISNLNISSATSAGFFANVRSSVTIKNVTFDNANVSGTHYVAVILAGEWNENASATIDNCTVINSTVTCDTDAANDNGDKVGGICGYAVSLNITNCTVKDTTIKAYRDFGGIIGCANANKVVVTGNTVENLTLIIDNEVNYKNYTTNEEHNANPIVGRVSNAEVKDNTATDCKVGREVYGLQLFTTGDSTVHGNIIVSDKEGLLNLTKLADNWAELFSNGQGTGYGDYTTQNGGAGGDYYYCWTWNIELTSDIDLGGATIDPIRLDLWGSFNGNNHTISNAKIVTDSTTENGAGLFSASYCSMKNIKLDNIHVTGSNVGNSTAGVLADSCNKDQGIDNITITNSSVTGGKYTGGVIGYGYTDITNCTLTNVTVKGGYKMGGLIGYICASSGTGDVTGNTLIDCTVDGIGAGVYAGGKDKYVIGKVVGNYNCNGTCNNNTITNMTTSATANIGEIEDNKTVTE